MILPILFLPHLGSPGEATRVIPASSASVPTSRLSKVLWTAEAPLSCGVLGSNTIAFRPAAALQVPTKSTVLPLIPPLAGSRTLTPSTPSPSRWGPVAHVWVSPLAEVPLRVLIDSVIPLRACELLQIGSDPRIEKRRFRCIPRRRPAERASESLASAQSASVRRAECWVAQRHCSRREPGDILRMNRSSVRDDDGATWQGPQSKPSRTAVQCSAEEGAEKWVRKIEGLQVGGAAGSVRQLRGGWMHRSLDDVQAVHRSQVISHGPAYPWKAVDDRSETAARVENLE